MTSSDSDSDGGFKRVDSTSVKLFLAAPEDIEFKIKIKPLVGGKSLKVLYTLKKGQKLPYEPDLDGMFFYSPISLIH